MNYVQVASLVHEGNAVRLCHQREDENFGKGVKHIGRIIPASDLNNPTK